MASRKDYISVASILNEHMDKIDEDRIGGDGRRMDDYVVLDDKTRRQGMRQNGGTQQQHARHH